MKGWEVVIGLETHCQLGTRTKLFCPCPSSFGSPPNENACPVCSGQPGVLPVLNAEALALGVRAGLALGCSIAAESRFDRKNYFYCDLPKGFQTTQYAQPFALGGGIELTNGRRVRLARIHLEEDAGKAIHERGERTLVDLNRAGVPLIEIVTEPDLRSSAEAHECLTLLREVLVYAGVSDCDMEKGSLRCDVNVSVRRPGEDLRVRVELKNLNSFRHVVLAIEHEVARQIRAYEGGEPVVQETRLFDAASGATRTMRRKEDEDDYRYFPEPDLPPARVDAAFLARERARIPELPAARRARYVSELGLSAYDAGVLTGQRALSDFFEATVALSGTDAAKRVANWVTNDLRAATDDPALAGTSPAALARLIELVEGGRISTGAGRQVLKELLRAGGDPDELVASLGLAQVSDEADIEAWCRAALAGRDSVVAAVRAGDLKALGAVIGPVMKASGGRANPAVVRETLLRLIGSA